MPAPRFLVGIDLGTSNSAMAAVDPGGGSDARVADVAISQLRRLGDVAPLPLLPSCIYLPGEHELPLDGIRLPWDPAPADVVGEFARWQGGRVPGRLVTSAKSWLSHAGVDRSAAVLPWGGAEGARLSPVEASARLLTHLRQSWDHARPDAPLAAQDVVVTVPASFDAVARALTVEAARHAGLETLTLLEEPQAAFYDFTAGHRRGLGRILRGVRLVLVVDVGGGTTDFTLITVGASAQGPVLRRIAVGEHILLGGDNMDAALARRVEGRMLSGSRRLSAAQWAQLTQACRLAKEALLGDDAPEQYGLAVAGEGSRLVGGTLSASLSRAETEAILLEGFLPACRPDDSPARAPRAGLQELGLPYAQDPAITRQLVAFLRAHADAARAALGQGGPGVLPRPDAILLNGGVFKASKIGARLVQVASGWWPDAPRIPVLPHASLDLAVARGAAYYGLVRRGLGRRIGGGTAHAFYVGLDRAEAQAPVAACLIPRGHEEGRTVDLPGRVFRLTLGRPVQFPLYTATSDRTEAPGDIVPVGEELKPLPPIHALLTSADEKSGVVPVHLSATLTAIGTLELSCVSDASPERWRLEFELRGQASGECGGIIQSMPPAFADARTRLEQVFGPRQAVEAADRAPRQAKQLWGALEQALGPRDAWSVPILRELWGELWGRAARRRRSLDHERVFFQLLGYTLRPGFGYPLDAWRAEQAARLFGEGVQFLKEKRVWIEFWVMWRRMSGGLSQARHEEIWGYLKPHLEHRLSPSRQKHAPRPKGIQPEGLDEMVRLAASLEHLPPAEKAALGAWLAARLAEPAGGPWAWALGRLGARVPLYGSAHLTVPPEQAAEWLSVLLAGPARNAEGALFAAVQLARLSGDRARDLEEAVRAQVVGALRSAGAPPAWERLVTEVAAMETADEARALGDTLPVGLALGEVEG